MSSGFWLLIIVIAASVLALANLQYQRVREAERDRETQHREALRDKAAADREAARDRAALEREVARQQALAREARVVLAPEIKGNLALVIQMQGQLTPTNVPLARFQTSAWETVSSGELVRGFQGAELANVAVAYELATRSNETLDQLSQFVVGVASSMSNAPQTRQVLAGNLTRLFERLRTALTKAEEIVEPNQGS
jgi:Tfp pilus assembly protein PilV